MLSTEPGKGLIVYRDFTAEGLSNDEVEKIEDRGVVFSHNVRFKLNQGGATLPRLTTVADTLGLMGHGRWIFRVVDVVQPSRKTFDQLTPGERDDLRDKWYVPEQARERAKAKLTELRKRCVDGAVQDFAAAAEEMGCRVHRDEWIHASFSEQVARPDKERLWKQEFLHMRDRAFLQTAISQALLGDRNAETLKAGSYFDVMVDTRHEDDDPGCGYLALLLERNKADATTIPSSELDTFLRIERNVRYRAEAARWNASTRGRSHSLAAPSILRMPGRPQRHCARHGKKWDWLPRRQK
jgi:hypothetical protein